MSLTAPSILDLIGSVGVLQFVGKTVLPSSAVNLDVVGLDGDADKIYIGFYDLFNDEAASSVQNLEVNIEPNGLTSGMRNTQVVWSGAIVSGAGGTNPKIAAVGSLVAGIGRGSGFFIFHAARTVNGVTPNNGERQIISISTQQAQSGIDAVGLMSANTWEDSTTNLTSIRLRNVASNPLGAGSQLTIYKLVDNASPQSLGFGGGLSVPGPWELIQTAAAPAGTGHTSMSFTGLDGDLDEDYMIEYQLVIDAAEPTGSVNRLEMIPNGITPGAAVTEGAASLQDGTGYTGFGAINNMYVGAFHGGGASNGRGTRGRIQLWAKTGSNRSYLAEGTLAFDVAGNPGVTRFQSSGTWDDTAANITSLALAVQGAGSFSFGSNMKLFRRVKASGGPIAGQNIGNLATVAVDAKAVAETLIYTVPPGKKLYLTGAFARSAAAVAITVGASAGIGSSGTADDGIAQTVLTDLLSAGPPEDGFLLTAAKTLVYPAGTDIFVGIDIAATGTSQTLEFDLIGYLK